MKIRVKFCHFKTSEEVQQALDLGVDLLGFHAFNFHGEGRGEELKNIMPTQCPEKNVLLSDFSLSKLYQILTLLPVKTLQLYSHLSPEDISILKTTFKNLEIIMVYSTEESENHLEEKDFIDLYSPVVEAFLIDSHFIGGTGKVGNIEAYKNFVKNSTKPVFIAGGLTVENVCGILNEVPADGVDVQSGVNVKTSEGSRKCPVKMRQFLKAVRSFSKS